MPSRIRPLRHLLLALSALGAMSAEAAPRLELDVALPPEPGRLEQCMAASAWRPHPGSLCLRVYSHGGCGDNPAQTQATPPLHSEQCFRLRLDGEVLVQGAVIKAESARLLRIPVLVIGRGQAAAVVQLFNTWPDVQSAMPAWLPRLLALNGGKDLRLTSRPTESGAEAAPPAPGPMRQP